MANQYYAVLKQHQIRSRHGNMIWEVQLVGITDRQLYRTYVDPTNRNFARWSDIVHCPTRGFVLSGVKLKNASSQLISADSPITVVSETACSSTLYSEIVSVWQEQDRRPVGKFGDLFE